MYIVTNLLMGLSFGFYVLTKWRGFDFSLEEIAEAFKTLWKDNKNGAVLTMSKAKDSPMKLSYVEQEWNEI